MRGVIYGDYGDEKSISRTIKPIKFVSDESEKGLLSTGNDGGDMSELRGTSNPYNDIERGTNHNKLRM